MAPITPKRRGRDVRLVVLWLRRLAVLLLGVLAVWLILFVFQVTDHRLSWIVALAMTYALAAYVILPRVVRMSITCPSVGLDMLALLKHRRQNNI